MSDSDWQDMIVGDRMAVDQEFAPRVADSRFSSQQWGLIMTATEFRIENPGDAENARLVADTSKIEHVTAELQDMDGAVGPMGAPGGGGGRGGRDRSGGSGGFLGSVKSALGLGGSGDDDGDTEEMVARADAMTREYAGLLQERLENEGKWQRIRGLAAARAETTTGERDPGAGDEDGGEGPA